MLKIFLGYPVHLCDFICIICILISELVSWFSSILKLKSDLSLRSKTLPLHHSPLFTVYYKLLHNSFRLIKTNYPAQCTYISLVVCIHTYKLFT